MGTTYKALAVQRDLKSRIPTGLKAALAKFNKWNNANWARPRHLLGLLCIEERRQMTAFLLLVQLGCAQEVRRAFGLIGAAAGERGTPEEIEQRLMKEVAERVKADKVSSELRDRMRVALDSGKMKRFLQKHGVVNSMGQLVDTFKKELILLAATPPRDIENDPLFSRAITPRLYELFIGLLFVGFAHNLLVESYVSRVSTISKVHKGIEPLALAALFMYKTGLEDEKVARRSKELRVRQAQRNSGTHLKLEKDLKKDGTNRVQLQALEAQAVARAEAMQARRAEFFKRKDGAALGRQVQAKRAQVKGRAQKVARRQLKALVRTCKVGPSGRAREQPLTAEECTFYVPSDKNVPENRRSNWLKKPAFQKSGDAKVKEQRRQKKKARKTRARKRKYTEKELSRLAVPIGLPKKARKPRRSKAATRQAPRPAAPRQIPILSDDSDDEGARQHTTTTRARGRDVSEAPGCCGPAASLEQQAAAAPPPPRSPRVPRFAATAARSQFAGADEDASDAGSAEEQHSGGESEASEAEVAPPKRRKRAAAQPTAREQASAAPAARRLAPQAAKRRVLVSDDESDAGAEQQQSEGESEASEAELALPPKRRKRAAAQPTAREQASAAPAARRLASSAAAGDLSDSVGDSDGGGSMQVSGDEDDAESDAEAEGAGAGAGARTGEGESDRQGGGESEGQGPGAVSEVDGPAGPSATDAGAAAARGRRAQLKVELKMFEHSFQRKHGRKLETADLSSGSRIFDKSVRHHMKSLYREYRDLRNV